jgi:uncharacterized protein
MIRRPASPVAMAADRRNPVSVASRRRVWPFALWLTAFYSAWLMIVVSGGHWATVLSHWEIAVAMAAGSYVAGSTPMGGGTVGFPILVLLLDEPAAVGRTFSFAVQSIGMVSASIFILSRGRPLAWRLLGWAMLGTLIGTPAGTLLVAPYAPSLVITILFTVIWASFGMMHLVRLRRIVGARGITAVPPAMDRHAGLTIGLVGGVSSSITGTGIDMLLYAVLVLVYRSDLKIAIPTSVVVMAFTSLVGIATRASLGWVEPGVFAHWLAAAPIVAVGAPLGVFIVTLMPRAPTLIVVSVLCIGQFVWTIVDQRLWGTSLALAVGGVLVFNAVFHLMREGGRTLLRATASQAGRRGRFARPAQTG